LHKRIYVTPAARDKLIKLGDRCDSTGWIPAMALMLAGVS